MFVFTVGTTGLRIFLRVKNIIGINFLIVINSLMR